MNTFPELYTNRLKLRKIEIGDVPSLVKYADNKKISDYIVNLPYPYREPDAVFRLSYVVQGFKNKNRYVFAIVLKASNEFIGEISLHFDNIHIAQLGYWVGEPFWNQGITTEAIEAVLKFGFEELQLTKIYATCHKSNIASGIVLLKNGLTEHNTNGQVTRYQLSQSEFQKSHPPQAN